MKGNGSHFFFNYREDQTVLFSREKGSIRQGDFHFVKSRGIEGQRMLRGDWSAKGLDWLSAWALALNPGSTSF